MVETLFAAASGTQNSSGGNAFLSFLPLLLIIAIMYLLILRPQAKKQRERQRMLESIKKGDEIITAGGIHGKVVGVKNNDQILIIKVDDNVKLEIDRTAVATIKKPALCI